MNPATFASAPGRLPGSAALIRRGFAELLAGVALLGLARWLWIQTGRFVLPTIPLLAGLSLIGHFGLFGISAGLWRRRGVPCVAPFQAPFAARSLSEFWARRWNRPFSELIQRTVYRPVAALAGKPAALCAGFALSGILHELAISVPARAGYGRPLAYFLLQGALVLVEKRLPPPSSEWTARARTLLAFSLPVPLLLIPAFLRSAIWPIIGMS
jgi:alginate O-acetyltransferase complex protein AlgI